jgi:hypothetical protein
MARHIDAYVEPESRDVDTTYTAKVTKTDDEQPVGVPVFFTAEDIEKQGLDPSSIAEVGVWVHNGFVLFVPVSQDVDGVE